MRIEPHDQFRKARLTGALEAICRQLELTETQYREARSRYEGVGGWLAESSDPALAGLVIYVQGSTAIGTTVKPIGRNEHDVDLIARLTHPAIGLPPAVVKRMVGDRLKEHGTYRRLLEEMCRCWRLDYANEFHLDITPSIPNVGCTNGGELVPDRELRSWKASNPKGYKALFERRALLRPRFRLEKRDVTFADRAANASVEPYPEAGGFKGLLRRAVQIAKRHRDVHFERRRGECAPISVIVTTLLSRSYEWCVSNAVYDDEYDLLVDVVRHMPDTIGHEGGRWCIWNETTAGENFAERWNDHPDRAASFFSWHRALTADLADLRSIDGLDLIGERIEKALGGTPANVAIDHIRDTTARERAAGTLRYGAAGLVAAAAASRSSSAPVRSNTFFGR